MSTDANDIEVVIATDLIMVTPQTNFISVVRRGRRIIEENDDVRITEDGDVRML